MNRSVHFVCFDSEQICSCQAEYASQFQSEVILPRDKRQILIETSLRLFNEYGYHDTGIDKIMKESGVSKTTLYKYFESKEKLIVAVLEYRHQQIEDLINNALTKSQEENSDWAPKFHVLKIFDALHEWFHDKKFFGCNFINASAEYALAEDPIHVYAAKHKKWIEDRVLELFDVEERHIASQLVLLMDGAIVTAHVRGDRNAAYTAKNIAECIMKGAA